MRLLVVLLALVTSQGPLMVAAESEDVDWPALEAVAQVGDEAAVATMLETMASAELLRSESEAQAAMTVLGLLLEDGAREPAPWLLPLAREGVIDVFDPERVRAAALAGGGSNPWWGVLLRMGCLDPLTTAHRKVLAPRDQLREIEAAIKDLGRLRQAQRPEPSGKDLDRYRALHRERQALIDADPAAAVAARIAGAGVGPLEDPTAEARRLAIEEELREITERLDRLRVVEQLVAEIDAILVACVPIAAGIDESSTRGLIRRLERFGLDDQKLAVAAGETPPAAERELLTRHERRMLSPAEQRALQAQRSAATVHLPIDAKDVPTDAGDP